MKKLFSIILATTLAFALLVSCGGSKESNEATTTVAESNETKLTITFLNSKGEIQAGMEKIAEIYKAETGVDIEIIACGAGEVPYTKITTMYNSGNAPTLAMLDPLDINALATEYALDLTNENWVAEMGTQITTIDGVVYSFPFCVEGRGIIYNKEAIESVLGTEFDPSTINTIDDFAALLAQLRSAGMENPVFLAKEDWSLGAHQLGFLYDGYDGTTDGSNVVKEELKAGTDPMTMDIFNGVMDTMDLLMEYNVASSDPLGADYDEGALLLAEGEVAFWANGNWAWPNMAEGGAEVTDEFGFLPFFVSNDANDRANKGMQAAATKAVMIDKKQATAEEQQAAKDFLNWLVFDEDGQKALVEECAVVPAASNNPNQPADPLGQDIVEQLANGSAYPSMVILPSDHWSVMGAEMQKYISLNQNREQFAAALSKYWQAQN